MAQKKNMMQIAMVEAAQKRGWKVVKRIPECRMLVLRKGKMVMNMRNYVTNLNSTLSRSLATSKRLTYIMLRRAGIAVPRGHTCRSFEDAKKVQEKLGYPLVVKPLNECLGHGVTTNIRSVTALRRAVRAAMVYGRVFIAEEHVPGTDYRVYVLDGRVLAATARRAPTFVADGRSTVKQQVERFERTRKKHLGPWAHYRTLKKDAHFERTIREQGLKMDSVPPKGEVIFMRRNSDISSGGMTYTVDDLPKSILSMCTKAVRALGLRRGGVDLLVDETRTPFVAVVNEVNSAPMFAMHVIPDVGEPHDVLTPNIIAMEQKGGDDTPIL